MDFRRPLTPGRVSDPLLQRTSRKEAPAGSLHLDVYLTSVEVAWDATGNGAVSDGRALVDAAERLAADVIVTDVSMPGMNGIVAARTILRRHPDARIVFATVHADHATLDPV
jgi:DNA-binding NarL/FixJ family response regulator